MTANGTARRGGVTVEAAPGGALRALELTPEALRAGGSRLAETILSTVRQAAAQANERARRILEAELGDLSDAELGTLGLRGEAELTARVEETTPDTWRL